MKVVLVGLALSGELWLVFPVQELQVGSAFYEICEGIPVHGHCDVLTGRNFSDEPIGASEDRPTMVFHLSLIF